VFEESGERGNVGVSGPFERPSDVTLHGVALGHTAEIAERESIGAHGRIERGFPFHADTGCLLEHASAMDIGQIGVCQAVSPDGMASLEEPTGRVTERLPAVVGDSVTVEVPGGPDTVGVQELLHLQIPRPIVIPATGNSTIIAVKEGGNREPDGRCGVRIPECEPDVLPVGREWKFGGNALGIRTPDTRGQQDGC
jgi:hypothetical protein